MLLTGASTGIGNATLATLVAAGHEVTTLDVKDAPDGAARHLTATCPTRHRSTPPSTQLDGPYDALGNIAGVAGSMGAELVLRVNVYGLRHLTERPARDGQASPTAARS